jgi:hypothetical protein
MKLGNEFSRLMNQGKKVEKNDIDFYIFGELSYLLTTISWYMTNKACENKFKQMQAHLHEEFKKRANHIGAKAPQKKAKETLPIYILRYVENVGNALKERSGSPADIYFHIGFKMMAIKMMEFTIDGDQFDIVKELLDYLHNLHNNSQLVTIDSLYTNKITYILNEQLKKPYREFISKEFIARFALLENELKFQLFQPKIVKELTEIESNGLNNNFPIVNQTSSNSKEQSTNLTCYSLWPHKTLAIGLAATAVGIALIQREGIAESAKTICKLQ